MPTGGIRARTSGIMIPAFVAPAAAGFTGPGDLVSGATVFYGLHAYNAAYANGSNPAFDLHNDGTGAFVATITMLTSGGFDTSSANSVISGGASRVGKVYDQTGGGRHQVQSNNPERPQLQMTGLNGGPAIFFDNSRGDHFTSSATTTATISQPHSYVAVMSAITGAFGPSTILGDLASAVWFGFRGNTTNYSMSGGAEVGFISVTDANIHSLFGLANGANSFMQLDTSTSAISNIGTTGFSSFICLGTNDIGGNYNGYIGQAGIWPSDISASFLTLNSNQKTVWGF